MQYLYSWVNCGQAGPFKGKINKWRHLQTTGLQLVLIGLLFFVILQNGSFRTSMNQKMSHEILEDIVNERLSLLTKEFEQVKRDIVEASRENSQHSEELKLLIRVIAREMGLPLPSEEKEQHGEGKEAVANKKERGGLVELAKEAEEAEEEESQIYSEEGSEVEESHFVVDDSDEGREINEEESDEDEETEEEGDEVQFEETIPQKSRRKCPSYEHLFGEEQSELLEQNSEKHQQVEARIKVEASQVRRSLQIKTYWDELTCLVVCTSYFILTLLVFICVLMVATFIKNPKSRSNTGETLQQMLNIGSSKVSNQDNLKMSKKEILLKLQ